MSKKLLSNISLPCGEGRGEALFPPAGGSREVDFATCLFEVARSRLARGLDHSPDVVIDEALLMRPRAYYLSFDYILRRLPQLRRLGRLRRTAGPVTPSRAQWLEIDAKITAYKARHPEATDSAAVAHLLNYCLPSRFYISRALARRIYNRHFIKIPKSTT